MKALSRRSFLGRGSVVAAAAGIGAVAPVAVSTLLSAESAAPAISDLGNEAPVAGSVDGAVVAHISNLSSGELSIFNGTRQVVINDPAVVSRLLHALQ